MLHDWDCILFDVDDTLFHFDAYAGLQRLFAGYDTSFTDKDYADYRQVNEPLWVDYQNGTITAHELQTRRFSLFGKQLGVEPEVLNTQFLTAMTDICTPLDGATSLLERLKGKVPLGIITNSFVALQQSRLERSGFRHYFDALVISEQVGVAKPDIRIFDHTLALLGNPDRQRVLMVGDTPESDILGGINAGLKTCWLDHGVRALPDTIKPTWQVTSLTQLEALLTE